MYTIFPSNNITIYVRKYLFWKNKNIVDDEEYFYFFKKIKNYNIIKTRAVITCVQLINSRGYYDHQSQQLGVCEYILHSRCPLYVPAVDKC